MRNQCPACGASQMNIFYSLDRIPVHSVRLLRSRDEALDLQTGNLDMAHCASCGFICNLSYDPDLQDYSAEYESTQAYSDTFNRFAHRLARQIIDRYDLHDKNIIEIGCGQGEFISLLCELGQNRGLGFDPAYDPARSAVRNKGRVTIIPDYYSEEYAGYKADFICCKMTLEHIRDVAEFVGTIRRAAGSQDDTTIFFQVPNAARVLTEVAFWDIYYEHCSYFTLGSLARLFRSQKFEVMNLWRDYGDQYIMIDARPTDDVTPPQLEQEDDLLETHRSVRAFSQTIPHELARWKQIVQDANQQGQKVVLWGSGSKGVAFLTTLNLCDEIEYTVDINPNKHDTYMAGTGQRVVSPDFLKSYQPDLVILMNPLYQEEISGMLSDRGVSPRIISAGE